MQYENKKLLERYAYVYGWNADDEDSVCRQADSDYRKYEETQKVFLLSDILDGSLLKEIEENTNLFENLPHKKIPIYLYFSNNSIFNLFLHKVKIEPLLKNERVVFLIGERILGQYFEDMQTLIPKEVFGYHYQKVRNKLNEVIRIRNNRVAETIKEANDFYRENGHKVREHIISGTPRILLIKHRFSQVIRNHTRDCNDALKRLGYNTFVSEEKSDISRIYRIVDINKYKPDIIIDIDELRYSYRKQAPSEIIYVAWVQDDYPHIMNEEMAKRLGRNDYLMNHFISDNRLVNLGYSKDRILDATICANAEVYKPYNLTDDEKSMYQADICLLSHNADFDKFIEESVGWLSVDETVSEAVRQFLISYCKDFKQNGEASRQKEVFLNKMISYLEEVRQNAISRDVLENFVNEIHNGLHLRLYRQTLADWILGAGYTNVKLWGEEWTHLEKFKLYAMGEAENGETLSKILQSSKIVIGNNFFVTACARAWESMLSGTLYMSNDVPEKEDKANIRKIMTENENLVIFHDKTDLLNKIDFYLKHEDERRRIVEKGRKKALATTTSDATMKKVMEFVTKSMEEQRGAEDC
ncbi:glycosyltransferase [Lachnospiraceae bacterium 47-T17]